MNQQEFLQSLALELAPLNDMERARVLDFYREMICDGIENGEEEQAVVAGFGAPAEVARQILEESRSTVPNVRTVDAGSEQSTEDARSTGNAQSRQTHERGGYRAEGTVHTIVIDARHTAVEVHSVPSGTVCVHFEPQENDRVSVSEEGGVFTFAHSIQYSFFHWHDIFSGPRRIVVDVPADFNGDLSVTTCNARLIAEGLRGLAGIQLVTSNAHLSAGNLRCRSFSARTSNGSVDLRQLSGSACTVESSNGRITAETCTFPQKLDLYTSNNPIRVRDIVSDNIEFSTQNGTVSAEIVGDMRDYAIRSHTSNASNTLPPELCYPEQTKYLNVSTSNAKIDVRFVQTR